MQVRKNRKKGRRALGWRSHHLREKRMRNRERERERQREREAESSFRFRVALFRGCKDTSGS